MVPGRVACLRKFHHKESSGTEKTVFTQAHTSPTQDGQTPVETEGAIPALLPAIDPEFGPLQTLTAAETQLKLTRENLDLKNSNSAGRDLRGNQTHVFIFQMRKLKTGLGRVS